MSCAMILTRDVPNNHKPCGCLLLQLEISQDRLLATVIGLEKPTAKIMLAELEADLKKQGIVYGIDHDALEELLEEITTNGNTICTPRIIARGKGPVDGQFATLQTHFASGTLQVSKDGTTETVNITEYLAKDSLVATLSSAQEPEDGIDVQGNPVMANTGTLVDCNLAKQLQLDEASGRITNLKGGYPTLIEEKSRGCITYTLRFTPALTVANQNLEARLILFPPLPGKSLPDAKEIGNLLQNDNIVSGVNEVAIRNLLQEAQKKKGSSVTGVIAKGTLPVNGKDSYLRFVIDVGPIPGKILSNGDIDFRERQLFIAVNEEQLIANRVPPTPGEPGWDVFGNTLAAKPGKDIPIKVSDDAVYDEESGEVRALHSGVLSVSGENAIKVCSLQVINGNIDYATGNIHANDGVQIKGDIKPHFTVSASGDIAIEGRVETGIIISDANICVKGGVTGERAKLEAAGDIDINFVEQGRCFAAGSIIIRKSAYYSRIHAHSDIHADKNSTIISGQLIASGSITCGNLGAANAHPGIIGAGISPSCYNEMFASRRSIAELESRLLAWQDGNTSRKVPKKILREIKKLEKARMALAKLDLGDKQDREKAPTITVYGTIIQGTEVRIGNAILKMPQQASRIRFHLDGETGSIVYNSL